MWHILVASRRGGYGGRRVRLLQGYGDVVGLPSSPAAAASSSAPAAQAVQADLFFPHSFFKLISVKCWLNEISQAPNSPLSFLLSQPHASPIPPHFCCVLPPTSKQTPYSLSHSKTQPLIFCLFNFIACAYLPPTPPLEQSLHSSLTSYLTPQNNWAHISK